MDELARALDIDPLELRLKNYAETDQKDDKPFTSPDGLRPCYDARRRGVRLARAAQRGAQPTGPKRRGIGFAAHDWIGGAGHPPGYAWVKLNGDGTADVVTGTHDIGTGTRTGLAQVAAEELGLPLEQRRDPSGRHGVSGRTRRSAPAAPPRPPSGRPSAPPPPTPSASCSRSPRRCWRSPLTTWTSATARSS